MDNKKVYHISETETRTVLSVTSMVWDNVDQTSITCKVLFEEFISDAGYLPFTAYKFDPMAFGREFFNDLKNETWGLIEPYKAPEDSVGA